MAAVAPPDAVAPTPLQPPWALPAAEPATVAATTLILLSLLFLRPPGFPWARRLAPASPREPTSADRSPHGGLRAAVEAVAVATASCLVGWSFGTLEGGVGVPSLWLGALGARLLVAALDAPSPPAGRSRVRQRLRMVAAPGWVSAAAVGAVALWTGTVRVDAIVQAQGPAPWAWIAFRDPLAFVLLPAFAVGAVGRPFAGATPGTGGGRAATWAVRAAEGVHVLLAAALGVVLFLGGWQATPGMPAWVGWLAFGLKGGALVALGTWLAQLFHGTGRAGITAIAAGAFVGSGLWAIDGLAPRVGAVSGPALFLVTAVAVLVAVAGRFRRRSPTPLSLDPLL